MDSAQDVRLIEPAAVADGRHGIERLQRGDAHLLSHGDGADGYARPVLNLAKQAAVFTGQLDAGWLAEPVGANVIVKLPLAQPQADLDRANVARVAQNFCDAQGGNRLVILA